jgi:hypothetical protein
MDSLLDSHIAPSGDLGRGAGNSKSERRWRCPACLADLRSVPRRGNHVPGTQASGGTCIVLSRPQHQPMLVCTRQTSWSNASHRQKDWLQRGGLDTCLASLLMHDG